MSDITTKKQRLQNIVDLLKFTLTLDDEEILKAAIETVIDQLEEEIIKRN